jgi:phosphoenolpyruvate carboxykinase (GTP)
MGDYFSHWLAVGKRLQHPPRIFRVNWFRVDERGKFIWPGFGENMRVLKWVIDRCGGTGGAEESPIGRLPAPGSLDTGGLNLSAVSLRTLLQVDNEGWLNAAKGQEEFFAKFGEHIPPEFLEERQALVDRLKAWAGPSPVELSKS